MTISVDWQNRIVSSTASITDLPAFHAQLRDLEDDAVGMIYPEIHKWKALDLGEGSFMYQADFVNGYTLTFPIAGNYSIQGNLNATINPVAGVYVERQKALAYATTAVGGSGPSADSIAAAVLAALNATTIPVNATHLNGAPVIGTGAVGDDWRGVGVPPQ